MLILRFMTDAVIHSRGPCYATSFLSRLPEKTDRAGGSPGPEGEMPFLRGEFTFAVWIKTTAREGTFLSLRGGQTAMIDVRVENSGWLTAEIHDDATHGKRNMDVRSGIVNDGTWHHIALVRPADGRCILYVDGDHPAMQNMPAETFQSFFSTPGPITTEVRVLGCERYLVQSGSKFGPLYFEGLLDEACVFNRALSSEELKKLAGVPE